MTKTQPIHSQFEQSTQIQFSPCRLDKLNKAGASFVGLLHTANLLGHTYPAGRARPHQPRKFLLNTKLPFLNQLQFMLKMQIDLNEATNASWRTAGFEWTNAVAVESVEGLVHFDSWKWWKKGRPDVPQAVLELIDIWHFTLSWLMTRYGIFEHDSATLHQAVMLKVVKALHEISLEVQADPDGYLSTKNVNEAWMALCGSAALEKTIDLKSFFKLCLAYDLTLDELFKRYTLKNVLNSFRQKHGYKTGRYLKTWEFGQEDNEHLARIYVIASEGNSFSSADDLFEFEQTLLNGLTCQYAVGCKDVYCLDRPGQDPELGCEVAPGEFETLAHVKIAFDRKNATVRRLPIVE